MWNGRTKTDLDAVYKEAQELERLEMIGDAEQKFREALDGFEKLLSATHEDTIAVAYRLASFYAQNDRMKDADAVLDWMTETHAKCFGKRGLQTMQHILHIVELFCNWNRNEDAKAFLSRIIDVVEEEDGDTENDLRSLLNSGSASAMLDMSRIEVIPGQPQNSRDPALTINRDSEPVAIDLQLGVAAGYVKTNDKAAEPFLLRLIEQCEKHPKDLAVQTLRCRNALLELYHKNNREKMNEALDQSKQTFWRVMNSAQEKTQPLFDAGEETAKWHVKAGQYDTADEIFVQIQSDAVETFGEDNGKIISLFRSIGLCYQKEGRWEDAEPWFEQALVACYRTLEEDSNITKRLEAALENQHYDM
jgi:tetratricopeptide (TPR) repeat protein